MMISYKKIMTINKSFNLESIGISKDYEASVPDFITRFKRYSKDRTYNNFDIFLILCNKEFLSNKDLRLFAVFCARQVIYIANDYRSAIALDVAERFAHETACKGELLSAQEISREAWRDIKDTRTAVSAARESCWSATRSDSSYAAWAAASDARKAFQFQEFARNKQIERLIEIFIKLDLDKLS